MIYDIRIGAVLVENQHRIVVAELIILSDNPGLERGEYVG
jgi:hypothetical protein